MRRNRFNGKMAAWLAGAAGDRKTVTYGAFANTFRLANQGCGPVLTDLARRLHQYNLPLLSALVVRADTGLPSYDAVVYRDFGIESEQDMLNEIQRCFDYDWSDAAFMRNPS